MMMDDRTLPSATQPLAVTDEIAAHLMGIKPSLLQKDRSKGHLKIPYIRIGRRVVYQVAALEKWLQENPSKGGVK
jgi:hypothetical protein